MSQGTSATVADDLSEPPLIPKRSCGRGAWLLVAAIALIAGLLFAPLFNGVSKKAVKMQATNNCRQIIISLKAYASDHDGSYPSGATANEAFRELFKGGQLEDERLFTASFSPYVPDNILGNEPDFAQALQARENHWAMTKGLKDESEGNCPVVFENAAQSTWPPRWDSRLVEVAKPGRVFNSRRSAFGCIVVGRNDGSVNAEKLAGGSGPLVTLPPLTEGKNLFELAGPHEIMEVER